MKNSSPKLRSQSQYECPDPATGGRWLISSHRELTDKEITRGVRCIVLWGWERPKAGQIARLKWPDIP